MPGGGCLAAENHTIAQSGLFLRGHGPAPGTGRQCHTVQAGLTNGSTAARSSRCNIITVLTALLFYDFQQQRGNGREAVVLGSVVVATAGGDDYGEEVAGGVKKHGLATLAGVEKRGAREFLGKQW